MRGTALWIVDGDTILLRRGNKLTSIRLWGIDAPEKKQVGGKAATRHLIKLIGRKRIKVVTTCIGKYGRIIGKIYYKGKLINLEMVKAGHAWWNKRYCPEASEIEKAEQSARKKDAGYGKIQIQYARKILGTQNECVPTRQLKVLKNINTLSLQIFCCIQQMTFCI